MLFSNRKFLNRARLLDDLTSLLFYEPRCRETKALKIQRAIVRGNFHGGSRPLTFFRFRETNLRRESSSFYFCFLFFKFSLSVQRCLPLCSDRTFWDLQAGSCRHAVRPGSSKVIARYVEWFELQATVRSVLQLAEETSPSCHAYAHCR